MEENRQVDRLLVAVEMERRGKNIYMRARELTKDPELAALLDELMRDEAKHHAQFTAMIDVFNIPDCSPEDMVLAAAKAADFFFPGGLMELALDGSLESCESLLEKAMQAERDSISFYGRLLSYVDDLDRQDIILRIMREEMNHLRTLTDRAHNLSGGEVK